MNRLINTIFCVALVAAGALTAHAVSPHELPCSYCTRTVAELASQGPGAAQTAWGRIQSGSAEWKAGNKSAPILEFLDHIGATHELLSSSSQNHPGVPAELALRNVMAATEALVLGMDPARFCSLIGACPICPARDVVPDKLKAPFDVLLSVTRLAGRVARRGSFSPKEGNSAGSSLKKNATGTGTGTSGGKDSSAGQSNTLKKRQKPAFINTKIANLHFRSSFEFQIINLSFLGHSQSCHFPMIITVAAKNCSAPSPWLKSETAAPAPAAGY